MATICLGHHLSRLCERSEPRFDVHRLDRAVATRPSVQQSGPFAHPPSSARAPSRPLWLKARESGARRGVPALAAAAPPPEYRGDAARCDNDGDTRLHCIKASAHRPDKTHSPGSQTSTRPPRYRTAGSDRGRPSRAYTLPPSSAYAPTRAAPARPAVVGTSPAAAVVIVVVIVRHHAHTTTTRACVSALVSLP